MGHSEFDQATRERRPWNAGRMLGAKRALKPQQVEFLKAAYQRAMANMQELGELIQKANFEAMGVLNRRFSKGLDELRAIMERSGSKPQG